MSKTIPRDKRARHSASVQTSVNREPIKGARGFVTMGSHRLPHRVRYAGESLREILRLLSDFANTFGALRRRWHNVWNVIQRRVANAPGVILPLFKLLVKSWTIWTLMAHGYDRR